MAFCRLTRANIDVHVIVPRDRLGRSEGDEREASFQAYLGPGPI